MGENVRNAMFLAFGVFLFIAAVTIGFYLFQTVTASVDSTAESTAASDRTQQMQLQIPEEPYTVSGAIVLQSVRQLADGGSAAITVDGKKYLPNLDIYTTNFWEINVHNDYTVSYKRNKTTDILETIEYTTAR